MCLLDRKGFILHANPDFNELIDVRGESALEDYLQDECIPHILKTLQILAQKDEKKAYAVDLRWKEAYLRSPPSVIEELRWDVAGAKEKPIVVLCGR